MSEPEPEPELDAEQHAVPEGAAEGEDIVDDSSSLKQKLVYEANGIRYTQYAGEEDLQEIIDLIDEHLSEPYSIYTFRYFINQWPSLCWLAHMDVDGTSVCVGTVVCRLQRGTSGYIAMLAVHPEQRGKRIASTLVSNALVQMQVEGAIECVLEAEEDNKAAQKLYRRLGFVATAYLHRYYLSGNSAMRLHLTF